MEINKVYLGDCIDYSNENSDPQSYDDEDDYDDEYERYDD